MTYILIIWTLSLTLMHSVEFNTKEACERAYKAMERESNIALGIGITTTRKGVTMYSTPSTGEVHGLCVEKGKAPLKPEPYTNTYLMPYVESIKYLPDPNTQWFSFGGKK